MALGYSDLMLRHSIYIQRVATRIYRDGMASALDEMQRVLYYVDVDDINARELGAAMTRARQSVREALIAAGEYVQSELLQYAEYEATYQADAIPVQLTLPTVAQITKATVRAPMVLSTTQSILISRLLDDYIDATAKSVTGAIKAAYDSGQSTSDLRRIIRGTREANYTDGLIAYNKRHAETVVRTGLAHYADGARVALARANPDLIERWQYLATLDGRTTLQCRYYDGRIYSMGNKRAPRIPGHYNCRSTRLLIARGSKYASPTRPSRGADGAKVVPGNIGQTAWLRQQPREWLEDALGAKWRAQLMDRGITVREMWRVAAKRPYTLAELRRSDSEQIRSALKEAGLL